MSTTLKLGWYVLYVRSCQEKKVHQLLQENQFESFLPMIKTVRQWSDRKKTIYKPFFPSYVFVNIRSPKEFHNVLNVKEACAYIRFGKEYARVTDKEIDQIMLLVGDKNIIDIETSVVFPKVGEIKKINYGSLNGLDCEIIEANNCNKIIVRIDSLQQNIIATIPLHSLILAS
ncbi:UpxY family transcription antiterminator [Aquimarina sp. RZ0]|uniref:UpxY family transcription antiterminator n=1 Tax=Aquimarina sp. RZ0 TaxID=2607730 RepID=UPI0011F1C5EC|nr:UpxY family transcription antiterminator [Aquimarina sp. RZ0]KAA1243792.1 UpxY family transcription antiterminator [Aquimarina sp. RZ0]